MLPHSAQILSPETVKELHTFMAAGGAQHGSTPLTWKRWSWTSVGDCFFTLRTAGTAVEHYSVQKMTGCSYNSTVLSDSSQTR